MMDVLVYIVTTFVWNDYLVYLLLFAGIYFSIRTGFLQARLIKPMLKLLLNREKSDDGISSFQAFSISLSGRVGAGNIVGTSTAIFLGGPGAIFWMWVLAFMGAASAFVESTLAQLWKTEVDGVYKGGPAYYMERGLNAKWYGIIYSVALLFATSICFPGIQANSIASSFEGAFGIAPMITGVLLVLLIGATIIGGIKRIGKVAELIVPFMALGYLLIALIVIILNISQLPGVIRLIISSAFSFDATFGGIVGLAIYWGVRRGIYSNEAGQGSAAHASAAADVAHPAEQGLVQAFSVYIDTLVVCSASALMVLITNSYNVTNPKTGEIIVENLPGVEAGANFVQTGVSTVFSGFGPAFIAIALALFCYTTLLSYYVQAEFNLSSLLQKNAPARNIGIKLLTIIYLAVCFISTVVTSDVVWVIGDIGGGLTVWINLIAILILGKYAIALLKDYEQQLKENRKPIFDPDKFDFKNIELWKKIRDRYTNNAINN